MIMSSGLNHGVSRSLPHLLGICLGFPAMIIAIGLGLGTVFTRFPLLHEVIRWLGIAYLLYLAWSIANTRKVGSAGNSRPFSFLQAAAFQWVNPKGWIMAIGALAAFTDSGSEMWLEVARIALTFFAVGSPCIIVWMLFGVGLQRVLTEPRNLRRFNLAMGMLLAASIIPIAFE
ncbi:LysE family translocator [Microbulbifer thermotolerans]|nr:LysE family translocator [Microbulbifer thermotolerans]WKT59230.1 LysE family translocator [Microbulbifer thermotolerans]